MIFHQPTNSRSNFNYNAFLYEGIGYGAHFHSNFELIYAAHGDFEVSINAQTFLLREGSAILVAPFTVHAFDIPAACRGWVCVFSRDFVEEFATKYSHVQFHPFRFSPDIAPFLEQHLFFTGQPDQYYCQSLLYLVCAECERHALPWQVDDKGFRSAVITYIADHFHEDISMRTLAETLGYEYHYFSNLFHRCFNMDFKKFVNLFRFERACYLLGRGTLDMTQISEQCGFSSIRNFNRVFKECSGLTPMQYRNVIRK